MRLLKKIQWADAFSFRHRTCHFIKRPSSSHAKPPTSLIHELEQRGMIYQVTHPCDLTKCLSSSTSEKGAVYCGFDPTAQSLHVGNLLSIIALLWFQMAGHPVIALVGGATGKIGDPSGKSTERNMLAPDVLNENRVRIHKQLETLFENAKRHISSKHWYTQIQSQHHDRIQKNDIPKDWGKLRILNNADWLTSLSLIDFLSTAGRHARVSEMLSRDSVSSRLHREGGSGISFTEFTYQLLQAYDFWHLYQNHGCQLQIGGSDQWGNIVEGTHLIRKMNASSEPKEVDGSEPAQTSGAYGLTLPLLVNKDGQKFGKSEGNAVWLDGSLLSPLQFYSFFRKTPDEDVEKLLRMLTFLTNEEVDDVLSKRHLNEHTYAQRVLASEMTSLVHGEHIAKAVQVQSTLLFDQQLSSLSASDIIAAFHGHETYRKLSRASILGKNILHVSKDVGLIPSIKQGRKQIGFGGFYVNEVKVDTQDGHERVFEESDLMEGKIVLLRIGKSKYRVLHLE